jgi:hypothetical protein
MTLAKIQATQKLYQSLTGTKHVHLKGRRVSPPRPLAPLPLPAPCALPNPAPTHARAGHGHHHSAHALGDCSGSAREAATAELVKNPKAPPLSRAARRTADAAPPSLRSADMITSVAIPGVLAVIGSGYLVRCTRPFCAWLSVRAFFCVSL